MTTTIAIIGDAGGFEGLAAELYDTSSSPPFLPPPLIAAGKLSGGLTTFTPGPPATFAIRLRDDSRTFLRTGVVDAGVGTFDENGNFTTGYLVERLAPVTFDSGELNDMLPDTPFTEDELTVNAIGLQVVGTYLRASGIGVYDAGFWGRHDVTFEYDFDLVPVRTAHDAERLVNVETREVTVVGANPGFFGWIQNLVVMIVAAFNTGTIGRSVENTIQARIDQTVEDTFAEHDAEAATGAVQSVTIGVDGIEVEAWGALPSTEISCPASLTAGSVRRRPESQLGRLRIIRSRILSGTPRGDAWVQLFEANSPELVMLLVRRPSLLKRADAVVTQVLDDLDEKSPEASVMSKRTVRLLDEALEALMEIGSVRLRVLARQTRPEIAAMAGKPVRATLENEMMEMLKVRPKGRSNP